MIRPPGEESNAYYKTQPKDYSQAEQYDKSKWKNMTQSNMLDKEMLKISGTSPLSTKNCTSKFNNFSLVKEAKFNPQLLELPDGLKDIGDSDIEPEEFESNDQYEDFSIEEKGGIRHIQDFTPDLKVKESTSTKHSQSRGNPSKNVNIIENAAKVSNDIKDTIGDFIDSSGGTIDAIDIMEPTAEPVQEITKTEHILGKNYSSVKKLGVTVNSKKSTKDRDDSFNETRNKLRELTQLTGDNCVKDSNLVYPLKPGQALRNFMKKLSDFEKGEILDYRKIWFLGLEADKLDGSPLKPYNYGYDDEKGDYKVVIGDHIGYRFEVIEPLGKGSFGQALR